MQVPSGRVFNEDDLAILKEMAVYGFVRYSATPFTLRSGIKLNVYVSGREDLTDNPGLEWIIGRKIAHVARIIADPKDKQVCLIGAPTAGTALAQAASMVSFREDVWANDLPICHRIMKEAQKTHGAHQNWVNGKPDLHRHSYWLVDNVVTDGGTKLEAMTKLKADGYPAEAETPCVIWIDRQQGAIPRLEKAGFKRIVVVYNLLDLTFAFGELGLWPKEAVKAVEQEIAAHQFLPLD